jgi:hypothetical protein
MGNEIITGKAEPVKSSAESNGVTGIGTSTSSAEYDFIKRRTEKMEAKIKESSQPTETQSQEQGGESQNTEEVLSQDDKQESEQPETAPESAKNKLGDVNIDELTDEDIRELAEKGKSGLLKRIAELTAKRKQAEEQLAAIKAEQAKQPVDPLKAKESDIPAEFKKLGTIEELQAKASEVEQTIEEAEELLWNNEHMGVDDFILTVNGKEYTKAQVRAALRTNQKIRSKVLPARLAEIQESQSRKTLRNQYVEQAKKELEWMTGQDNDTKVQFEALKESPVLKKAVASTPELEPYLEYMVAHAANSMFNRKPIAIDSKPKPALQPTNSPTSGAARAEQPESRLHKSLKDAASKFKTSGREDDFVALRAAKMAQRMR